MIHIAKQKKTFFRHKRKKKVVNRKPVLKKTSEAKPLISEPKTSFVSVLLKRHRDTQGNHHHVILEDIEDKHVSVGTTTKSKKGKNSTNYGCDNDIVGTGQRSYLRRQGIVDFKTNYSDPKQGRMTIKDYAQAKIYGQRAKEKYLAQKKKSND